MKIDPQTIGRLSIHGPTLNDADDNGECCEDASSGSLRKPTGFQKNLVQQKNEDNDDEDTGREG